MRPIRAFSAGEAERETKPCARCPDNAQGRGGPPKTARGRIFALHQQIVAKDETGDTETLNNVIATDAPVVPGYSGGPLENFQNRVIGMVTAGSTTLATYSNLNAASGYVQKSFSLGSYAGSTVALKFTGVEDSSLQTSFVIDDTAVTTG